MNPINVFIVRAGCWLVLVLILLAIIILLDIWRNQKQLGKPASAVAMIVLAATLGAVGMVFARCAWTGDFPKNVKEVRR